MNIIENVIMITLGLIAFIVINLFIIKILKNKGIVKFLPPNLINNSSVL